MIYLDYNATTPLAPGVLDAMRPYLERHFGNPSSIHQPGREARAIIDESRDRIARLLGSKSHEIVFTAGGTESDNLAILGLARENAARGRHLITCATEHHAVLHAFQHLQKKEGFVVSVLDVESDGLLDPARVEKAITPATTLVSVMTANNETGVKQPVSEIAAICRKHGVLFHTDAVQSFGKEKLTVDADAISLAAHKFYGPKGAGVLYLRAGISIQRLGHGGSHEGERRPGTENVAAIAGMACAAELAVQDMEAEAARQAAFTKRLWQGISSAYPAAIRNGSETHSLSNTLNVSFPGLDGESLLINFDLAGMAVSSGSACMVGSIQASHVLLAMGVQPDVAQATIRFSTGKQTTTQEIELAVSQMPAIFERLSFAAGQ